MQAMQLSRYSAVFANPSSFLEDELTCQLSGFGAAKHLAESGYNVTLVDAAPNPGGLSAGWRTPQGRAVEAGIKGFWYQASSCCMTARESAGHLKAACIAPLHFEILKGNL